MRVLRFLRWAVMFHACIPLSAVGQAAVSDSGGARVDFQDVPIRTVISALAEAGQLNVVFGELPERSITLRMEAPVPPSEVLDLLRTVAEANGLEVMQAANVVVVSLPEPDVADAQAQPAQDVEREIHVYRLRHSRAPALAQTLRALFGAPGGSAPVTSASVGPEEEPGRDLFALGVEIGRDAGVAIPGELSEDLQIVADEATNSILVRATAADWNVIEQSIQALDQRPLQVLIEMLVVEVRHDRDVDIGVSYGTTEPVELPGGGTVEGALTSSGEGVAFASARQLEGLDIDVALSLLAASGDVRIVSRPVILAQNNRESSILIGSERPFIQVFRSLPTEAAVRDQIVQYRDIGTSLTITPTIYADGYVNLSVQQEISTATAEVQFGAPVISTRQASAELFARAGQTVVIGGLIDEQRVTARTGIPLLMNIPILGYLFGSTTHRRQQSELFLFLTAHVVESDEDVDRILDALEEATEMLPALPPPIVQTGPGGEVSMPAVRPLMGAPDTLKRSPSGRYDD